MKIGIIGANGKSGKVIMKEAAARGHEVTAIVRDAKKITDKAKIIEKDIFDLKSEDLKNFDAVVDAFGAWTPETLHLHSDTLKHLGDILKGTDARLLVVGSAGSLYVNKEHTVQMVDTPEMPEMYKPLAKAMVAALAELRKRSDFKWTYLSPAGFFDAEGKRTGKYILAGEELTLDKKGQSYISYEDYAIAMVDEIEKGQFIGKRFSVLSETE